MHQWFDKYITSRLHARKPTELDVAIVLMSSYLISPLPNFFGPELSAGSKEIYRAIGEIGLVTYALARVYGIFTSRKHR